MSVPAGNVYDKESAGGIERRLVGGFNRAVASLVPRDAARVLEVGCGEGHQLRRLRLLAPRATLVGLDLPDPSLAHAWRAVGAHTLHASALSLPADDRSFDVVCALEVLEHLDDPEAAVRELVRVSSHWVVASVPWEPVWRLGNLARGRYVRARGNTPGHVVHFGRRAFVSLLSRHLRVDAVRRPLPWTVVRGRVP